MNIIGLDCGRSSVKVFASEGFFSFPSILGEWRDRRLTSNFGKSDLEVEFQGEKYFAGTLAENESEFSRSMMTDEKVHEDTRLLCLIALHQANKIHNVSLITGLPVEQHELNRKQKMKDLLLGDWEITVNGVTKLINIVKVEVSVEGGGAFWSQSQPGLVRIIDAGSKTINYVTMKDKRYIDKESGTLPFGFDTNKSSNVSQMAKRIVGELGKKWGSEDNILVCGGRAEELASLINPHFYLARPMPNPLYANAMGFYNIGRMITSCL